MATSLRVALDAAGVDSAAALATATGFDDRSTHAQIARALIGERYRRLDSFRGPLGIPLSPVEQDREQGWQQKFASNDLTFLNGEVGVGSDDSAIVIVRFLGFKCLEESNEGSASDEPYFFVGVVGSNGSQMQQFGPYDNIDEGEERYEVATIAGLDTVISPPVVLGVVAMEHDSGTPEEAAEQVRDVLKSIEGKLDQAAAAFGATGDNGHVMPEWMRDIVIGWVPEGVAAVFGMGDDQVGSNAKLLFDYTNDTSEWTSPEIVGKFGENDYRIKLPVGTDSSEGRYEAYFDVRIAHVHITFD